MEQDLQKLADKINLLCDTKGVSIQNDLIQYIFIRDSDSHTLFYYPNITRFSTDEKINSMNAIIKKLEEEDILTTTKTTTFCAW